jgi:UDP-glucose 4-epimerase
MCVLLTGSSGWLGRFLAPALRAVGHSVVGMDIVAGAETQIVGSVARREDINRAFENHAIEAVIHAGGLHQPDLARRTLQSFVDINVTGTLNLLEAAVEAGHDRFVFTSTTSLMISQAIHEEKLHAATWLDETLSPLEPRNIYGVTKLAAEHVCRLQHLKHGLNCVVLRTARFFPGDNDSLLGLSDENLKANEFLSRRLTVEDAARAHLLALERAPAIGFGVFIISPQTPFDRSDLVALGTNAAAVIARRFPEAKELYSRQGWQLPARISRVYDTSLARSQLGFVCETDFRAVLEALRHQRAMPFKHAPILSNSVSNLPW